MSNDWRFLALPLINCEIELDLSWSKECIVSETSITSRVAGNPNANPLVPAVEAMRRTGATFQINNGKFYVPVATFSVHNNMKFLENIKQGFKRTISWNKYRAEISFKNAYDDSTRNSFDEYCMPLVEIKDFNVLIDNKSIFDHLVKNKQEA